MAKGLQRHLPDIIKPKTTNKEGEHNHLFDSLTTTVIEDVSHSQWTRDYCHIYYRNADLKGQQ